MDYFLQQVISGLTNGLIYGSLALAIVIVYKSMDMINFAQGEMAMFSTFVAFTLLKMGVPYWLAFSATVVFAFFFGVLIQTLFIRPMQDAPQLTVFMTILAVFIGLTGLATVLFGADMYAFPSPIKPIEALQNKYFSTHVVAIFTTIILLFLAISSFFRFTKMGLAMRATAMNRTSSQLSGINTNFIVALSWGIASAIGAISGMMIAPSLFLDINMMATLLIYSVAGALLGGITSPLGAVVGGLLVGVIENLASNYIPFIGSDLKLTVALVIIVVVSLVRPAGLFGKHVVTRV